MSRTARIVLTAALAVGALVTGGIALTAHAAPPTATSTAVVEAGGPAGLRPAQPPEQDEPRSGCPDEGATTGAAAIRL